jgi:hypothetical protein
LPHSIEHGNLASEPLPPLDRHVDIDRIVKIGSKIVSHGRYVTFQMVEAAIPRDQFAGIPRRIDFIGPNVALS